jgi:hypothetical protein
LEVAVVDWVAQDQQKAGAIGWTVGTDFDYSLVQRDQIVAASTPDRRDY